jgi:3-hydroxybutyryl-CoA dehydrogenase
MRERIAIVGAGLMGHGIAQVFAVAGRRVALHDPDPEVLASAPERIAANLESLALPTAAVDQVELHPQLSDAVGDADFVFEAAPERLTLKQELFTELERLAPADAVLASNTSVIPISAVAARARTPERIVGTHWWNPPYLIDVVEVVQAERSSRESVERTINLLAAVGKDPVHVKRDVPGFVGNRLQHALWREAFALVENGVCDAETVDRVVKGTFGRRLTVMGPIENADYIGLDLTLDIHEQVISDLDRTPGPSPYLRALVRSGRLGAKTGEGFRQWAPGEADALRRDLIGHLRAEMEQLT